MKTKLLKLIGCAFLALIVTGCKTTSTNEKGETVVIQRQFDAVKTARLVETLAADATRFAVAKNPETRRYFESAKTVLDLMITDGVIDPEQVRLNLSQYVNIPQEAALAISAGVNLYMVYGQEVVAQELNKVENLRPILVAFRNGLVRGLALPPTANYESGEQLRVRDAAPKRERATMRYSRLAARDGVVEVKKYRVSVWSEFGLSFDYFTVYPRESGSLEQSRDGGNTWATVAVFDADDLVGGSRLHDDESVQYRLKLN